MGSHKVKSLLMFMLIIHENNNIFQKSYQLQPVSQPVAVVYC